MASSLVAQMAAKPHAVARTTIPRMPQLSARTAVHAMNFHKKIAVRTAAAEDDVEAAVEAVPEAAVEIEEAAPPAAGSTEARLAALAAAENVTAEEATYALNFLWLDKNIAVAVDQVFGRGHRSPVTEYFFWPRKDAWEELKASLEGKTWMGEREKVLLLNRCTEVINYWQDESKHSVAEAGEKFPECKFQGS